MKIHRVCWGKEITKTEEGIQPPPQCICLQPASSSAAKNKSIWTLPGLQETERGWPRCSMDSRGQFLLSDPGTAARGSGNSLGYIAGCLLADWSSRPRSEKRRASERRGGPRSCRGRPPALRVAWWVLEPGWRAAWSTWVLAAPQNQTDWWCHRSTPRWLHSRGLRRRAWKTWNKTQVININIS